MSKVMSMEERIQMLEDKEAIRDIIYRYVWLLDEKKWDELSSLFCEDSKLIVHPWGEWNGRKGVKDFFLRNIPSERPSGRHCITNIMTSVFGDKAESKNYFDSTGERQGRSMVVAGWHYDKLVKREDGKWYFKEREISFDYSLPLDVGWGGLRGENRIWGDSEGRLKPPAG